MTPASALVLLLFAAATVVAAYSFFRKRQLLDLACACFFAAFLILNLF